MNKSITKLDVSRLAGVSHMTVTRVLNGFPYVKPKTRNKVLHACRELNYHRNLNAAILRGKKSYAIGVVVPTFKHMYFSRLLSIVEAICRGFAYHIIAIQRHHGGEREGFSQEDIEFLLARKVDGLLIARQMDRGIIARLKKENIPSVFIDIPPMDNSFSFVGDANFEGMRELTQYFLQRNHRAIAFLAGPKGHYTSEQRLAGYHTALSEAGLGRDERLVGYTDYDTGTGFEAARRLLKDNGISFTAIIGANDYIAIGALAALSEFGIKVPGQISVAGFTGDEIGAYSVPPLTTMVQSVEEKGKKAVELLFAHINDPKQPVEKILLPAVLLKRGSVRALIEVGNQ